MATRTTKLALELQIADLTAEVVALRAEVSKLRAYPPSTPVEAAHVYPFKDFKGRSYRVENFKKILAPAC